MVKLRTPRPHPAPGYSRAAGSSLSDKPSRPMSPSSMALLAARSRASGRTGSRREVTSSSWAPRARGGEPGSGRDSPPPPPQTQDAQLYSWGAKLGSPGARLATPPPQLFGLGGPKPASCPPRATCGRRPRPARSSATPPAASHPTPDTERSERAPGTPGTNSRRAPQPAPRLASAGASPPAPGGRLISRAGWWGRREGSPLGKGESDPAPRDRADGSARAIPWPACPAAGSARAPAPSPAAAGP